MRHTDQHLRPLVHYLLVHHRRVSHRFGRSRMQTPEVGKENETGSDVDAADHDDKDGDDRQRRSKVTSFNLHLADSSEKCRGRFFKQEAEEIILKIEI